MALETPCPCGTQKDFGSCCKPYLEKGQLPPTAEALMRSRYSAFALGNGAYLMESWHGSTVPKELNMETTPIWCGLEIVATQGGKEEDREGVVEFRAQYMAQGKVGVLHEVSSFIKEEGRWFYVKGEMQENGEQTTKVGRNDPCPCGSGKKFKKCCG